MKTKFKVLAMVLVVFLFTTFVYAAENISGVEVEKIDDMVYTGSALTPDVVVTNGETVLVKDTDYTVSYKNNKKIGTATVTITGIGEWEGTKSTTFRIGYDISTVKVTGVVDKTYTGSKLKQSITVKYGKTTLKDKKDFSVSYVNSVNVGEATMIITGKGNYVGSKEVKFNVTPRSVKNLTFTGVSDYKYTGTERKPTVTVKYGKVVLEKDTDYTVEYVNNINVGTASVIIRGKGNYTGKKTLTYSVIRRNVSDVNVEGLVKMYYTGSKLKQKLTLTFKDMILVDGTDYTLSYKNNVNVGKATVTITGKGNYKGTQTYTFKIGARNVAELDVEPLEDRAYTSNAIKPAVVVKDGEKTLKANTDYTLSYKNNVALGVATIVIRGKGNYGGEKEVTFNIVPRSITKATVTGLKDRVYTGGERKQTLTLVYNGKTLKEGVDYTLAYTNNIEVGQATVIITGIGNFRNENPLTYKIQPKNVSELTVEGLVKKYYTGEALTQELVVKNKETVLKEGTDYTLTYKNNVKAGTATVTVTGKGSYTGSISYTFKIGAASIADTEVPVGGSTYTGKAIKPNVVITFNGKNLVKDTDYTIEYKNNTNVGEASMIITGKGNFTGSKTVKFSIIAKSIEELEFGKISDKEHTGKEIKPGVTIKDGDKTLVANTDYTLSYNNNVEIGIATVTITGKGNYVGTKELTFNIVLKSIAKATVTGLKDRVYTGGERKQTLTLVYNKETLVEGTDYTLAYENNINVGTATVTISGIGSFSGTNSLTYKINAKNVSELTVEGLVKKYYTGEALTQELVVKNGQTLLKEGSDYTLSYKNNKNVGTATVTLTCKGNYTGSKEYTFKIGTANIANVNVAEISDKVYTGKAIKPAVVVTFNSKNLVSGTDYTIAYSNNTKVGTATITLTGKGNFAGTKEVNFRIIKEEDVVTGDVYANGTYSTLVDIPKGIYKIGRKSTTKIIEKGEYGDEEYTYEYLLITENTKVQLEFTDVTLEKVNLDTLTVTNATSFTKGVYKVNGSTLSGLFVSSGIAYPVKMDTLEPQILISGATYVDGFEGEMYFVVEGTAEKVNLDNRVVNIKNELGSGIYFVGYDIAPGIYQVVYNTTNENGYAYSYSTGDVYYTTNFWGLGFVGFGADEAGIGKYDILVVSDDDALVQVKNATITRIDVDKIDHIIHEPTAGVYVLGKDMDQGTYKIVPTGEYPKVIIKENTRDYTMLKSGGYITIGDNVGYIAVNDARLVPVDLDSIEENPQTSVSDGLYLVGKEIESGVYKVTGKNNGKCTVVLYQDSWAEDHEWKTGYIEINEYVQAVEVKNGNLVKIDLEGLTPDYQSVLRDGRFIVGVDVEPGWYKANDLDAYYETQDGWNSFGTTFRVRDGYVYIDPEIGVYVEVNMGTLTKVDGFEDGIYRVDGEGLYVVYGWEKIEGATLYVDLTQEHNIFAFDGALTNINVNSVKELGEVQAVEENVYVLAQDYGRPEIWYTGEQSYNEAAQMIDYVVEIDDLGDYETLEVYFNSETDPLYTIDADEIRENDNRFVFTKGYNDNGELRVRLVKVVDNKEVYSGFSNWECFEHNGVNIESVMQEVNEAGKPVYMLSIYPWGEKEYQGYEIYKVERIDKPLVKVADVETNEYEVTLTSNKPVTYFARGYEEIDGHKFYTNYGVTTLKPLNVYNIEEEGIYRVSDVYCVLKNGNEEVNVIKHPNEDWGYIYVDETFETISTTGIIMRIDMYDKFYKSEVGTGLYVLDRDLEYTKFTNSDWGEITVISKDGSTRTYKERYELIELENRDDILVLVEWTTLKKLEREENPRDTLTDGLWISTFNMAPGIYAFSKSEGYEWSAGLEFKNSGKNNIWINNDEIEKVYVKISETDTITIQGGVLTRVDLEDVTEDIKTTLANDSYVVGKELEPGLYQLSKENPYDYGYVIVYREVGEEDYEYHGNDQEIIEIRDDAKIVEVYNATLTKVDVNTLNVELNEEVLAPNNKYERWAFYKNNGGIGVVALDINDRSTWTILAGYDNYYMKVDEETTVYTYGVGHFQASILDDLNVDRICNYNSEKGVFECTLDSSNISEFDGWKIVVDEEPYYMSPDELSEKAIDNNNMVSHVTVELAKNENHNIYVKAYKIIDGDMVDTGWRDYIVTLIPESNIYDAGNGIGLNYRFNGNVRDEDVHCELYKCNFYSENIEDYTLVSTEFRFMEGAETGAYYITRLKVDMDGETIVGSYSEPYYYAG